MDDKLRLISQSLQKAFIDIVREFNKEKISVVMTTNAPQRGRMLSEFNKHGGNAYIAGGPQGKQAYTNVPQYGTDQDTSHFTSENPPSISSAIVNAVPSHLMTNNKIALFSYARPSSDITSTWRKLIQKNHSNVEIFAHNEQNTSAFFEEKSNLSHILKEAGLEKYIIPSKILKGTETRNELGDIYDDLKNENEKVVLQYCGNNAGSLGASGRCTLFFDDRVSFVQHMIGNPYSKKVSTYIEGASANLSFFVGNTKSDNGRGIVKLNLPEDLDPFCSSNIDLIEKNARKSGLDKANTFSIVGNSTLKVVGYPALTNRSGIGVGNAAYIYPQNQRKQILEIGDKLGRKMALCGKVGLAGTEFIIDRTGKIWIHEINDRQQGPTDHFSFQTESQGVPSLSRIAWFAHYGDFTNPKNMELMCSLQQHAKEISEACLSVSKSFYIKAHATHDSKYDGNISVKKDLLPGRYLVSCKNGIWEWDFHSPDSNEPIEMIDLRKKRFFVDIEGGGLKRGERPPAGAQIFRITGQANVNNLPFVIESNASTINPEWVPIVDALYVKYFGETYLEKNPLRKNRVSISQPVSSPLIHCSV